MSISRMLDLEPGRECDRIAAFLRDSVHRIMRRRGVVVGISGGVDSSVVLALSALAFGPERVTAVMMPEKESDPDSERLARSLAARYGVIPVLHDITPMLEAFGCYRLRDEAIRRVFPDYDPRHGCKAKLALPPDLLNNPTLNVFSIAMERPDGAQAVRPVPPAEFRQVVAASAFKQRTRMAVLYYYAELHHYAVAGTANKNERDQGFFVKHGDGGADIMPIVHLFKTQVYQLAEHLDVPEEIRRRPPTTDTYSAASTQQDFFFRLPFATMDVIWNAMEQGLPPDEIARTMGLGSEQVRRVFDDLGRKARTTAYLRMPPLELSRVEAAVNAR